MGKGGESGSRELDGRYAHSAGAIGVLVMIFAGLTAIKVKVGLPWPAAVALTAGALIAHGYAAWWVKTRVDVRHGAVGKGGRQGAGWQLGRPAESPTISFRPGQRKLVQDRPGLNARKARCGI
ncbi:hypothetical protein [Streptomyces sp. NRRL F-2664]|uniref:hypothetical protein n=1 Tax=Streptomyces sp. NRRL F-2664 TaxID=1463842 RepID=UPI00131AE17E|nr:hypothetical protein [Streptomyces sp. NRRL F-2664]